MDVVNLSLSLLGLTVHSVFMLYATFCQLQGPATEISNMFQIHEVLQSCSQHSHLS